MKTVLSLSFTVFLAFSTFADDRPNILLIMTDDMGYSDLGCYGSEIETPHLDKLADGGIRYTQMYNTSKCWTTRISLLTGLYHIQSSRNFDHSALVSEVLGPAGYNCWWSGKHHAGFNPYERGFDHFSGFLGGAINFWNPSGAAREGEPAPKWKAGYAWAFDEKIVTPYIPDKDFFATDRFTDWALEWLDGSKDDEKPFFLYVAYNAPHWPLHAHPKDIAKYEDTYVDGYQPLREARYKRQLEMGIFDPAITTLSPQMEKANDWSALPDDQKQLEAMRMATHAAMVDNVDQNVGRLVAKLKEQGRLDNTLILFLVDNGASAERSNGDAPVYEWGSVGAFQAIGRSWANAVNTPLRYWKATSHEGGINTPMIAHWPKGIKNPGRFYRHPVHLIDFLPTWMELAGAAAKYPGASKQEAIPALEGVSITPSFTGAAVERSQALRFQYAGGKAVREGNWKLVKSGNGDWELYNLKEDRVEVNDLAESHPEKVSHLSKEFDRWINDYTSDSYSVKQTKPNSR